MLNWLRRAFGASEPRRKRQRHNEEEHPHRNPPAKLPPHRSDQTNAATSSSGLRAVPGALVASDKTTGQVVYNMLTPNMRQFMGRCVGAIKEAGIAAKGTGQFSILTGEDRAELSLGQYYQPSVDPALVEQIVAEARRITASSAKPRGAGVRIDSGVVFDFPATWQYYKKGNQCVFDSPRREQVILSAFTVNPLRPSVERDGYLDEIFRNGLQAAQRAIEYPDFRITKPLAEDRGACALNCWTAIAETKARDVFFAEAVICHKHGTIILTYEAPFLIGTEEAFRSLLRLIYEG
jgi:hypothetical protein